MISSKIAKILPSPREQVLSRQQNLPQKLAKKTRRDSLKGLRSSKRQRNGSSNSKLKGRSERSLRLWLPLRWRLKG
jgi:hypothetical protein